MSAQTAAFADELTKLAKIELSPLAKRDLIQGSLMGMGFESVLNPFSTPTSVIREGVGGAAGDVLGSAVARRLKLGGFGQFMGGNVGQELVARVLRKIIPGRPATPAAERVAKLKEFAKKSSVTHLTPQSSNVHGYSYDRNAKTLRVNYKSGGSYEYQDVDPKVVKALKRNKSVGKTINKLVKPSHEYEKVGSEWSEDREAEVIDDSLLKSMKAKALLSLGAALSIPREAGLSPLSVEQERIRKIYNKMMNTTGPVTTLPEIGLNAGYAGSSGSGNPVFTLPHLPITFSGRGAIPARDAILAHEAGHRVNEQALDSFLNRTPILGRLPRGLNALAPIIGMGASMAAIERARAEEQPTYVPSLLAGAASLPMLAEEGMASARAAKFLTAEHGLKRGLLKSLPLVPAFATYLSLPLLSAVITHGRKKYREETGGEEEVFSAKGAQRRQLEKALKALDEEQGIEEDIEVIDEVAP